MHKVTTEQKYMVTVYFYNKTGCKQNLTCKRNEH